MILILGGAFQGKEDFARARFGEDREYLVGIQDEFRLNRDKLISEIEDSLESDPDMIIIANEIGSGIVPMEKEERIYREEYGRYLCELAKKAEEVWRVFAGIGTRIK